MKERDSLPTSVFFRND